MDPIKLISWNVNGLRACLNKGFTEMIEKLKPDILCIQETKMQPEQNTYDFAGYHQYWNAAQKKGYSGTAIFSKDEANNASYGIGIERHDTEGRVITLEYDEFYLVNVYTPNSQRELARLPYRMEWEDDFRAYLMGLDAKKPVIVCGDLNVAHREIDIKNPKTNVKNAGFTPQEREKMDLLTGAGFTDTFRHIYPDRTDAYTWWSYMANARERNVGWRIDYFLVSDRYIQNISEADIYPELMGSDHCPVGITIARH